MHAKPVQEMRGIKVMVRGTFQSHLRGEVDVSHQWGVVALLNKAVLDFHAGIRLLHTLHCEPDNITAGVGTLDDLVH